MLRHTFLLVFLVILASLCASGAGPQVICALGPGAASYKLSDDQRPSNDAMQIVSRVNTAAKTICAPNCPGVALFRNSTASNAMLIADGGQAKLVYSPQFLASAYDSYGDAGVIALIAHVFGHALDDALGAAWIKSNWTPELRADSWAGCTLARSNFSQSEAQAALSALAKYTPSAGSAWTLRLPAIRAGFTACGGDPAKFESAGRPNGKK